MSEGENQERLRVLISTSTFPTREGDGQARFVLDLAEALADHADVTVLAPHARGLPTRKHIGRVAVRRFRYFLPTSAEVLAYGAGMRDNMERSWLARLQVPLFLAAQVVATAWTLFKARAQVINSHWLVPQGVTSGVVGWLTRTPMVLHVHAADVYFLSRFVWGGPVARFAVRRASTVLADGSHVRDALDDLLGYPSDAVLRPMGVWTEKFQRVLADEPLPSGLPELYVVFVGRLVEKKGVRYLIEAMEEVRRLHPELDLVVVGSGPLRPELESLAQTVGGGDHVHFLGSRSHEEVARLLRGAAVACVPSIVDSRGETEGMPTVVLEAMAAGVPVVGSEVDGIPDVLKDAENGWLSLPGDSGSLARGLLAAIEAGDGTVIVKEGLATAQLNDWAVVAEEYATVLRSAIGD